MAVPPTEDGTTPGPNLPLSCDITADVQARLISAATRQAWGSADFLMPFLAAALVVGVMAFSGSARVVAGTVVIGALFVTPALYSLDRMRARLRSTYAVGSTVRASVTAEGLWLSLEQVTGRLPWTGFSKIGIGTDAVLLHRKRRLFAPDKTMVLPADLFDANALAAMSAAIRGRGKPSRLNS